MANVDSVLIVAVAIGLFLIAVCAGWPLVYGAAWFVQMWRLL